VRVARVIAAASRNYFPCDAMATCCLCRRLWGVHPSLRTPDGHVLRSVHLKLHHLRSSSTWRHTQVVKVGALLGQFLLVVLQC
jgi:hypothetical protein